MLKILEILEDLNKFCPTEIWSTDRFQLAANILDQLPANIEAGTVIMDKNHLQASDSQLFCSSDP